MDGTFKSTPALFDQLYTIHGRVRGITVPLVYCLLPSRERDTYQRMMELLKREAANLNLVLQPQIVQIDFEAATLAAIRLCFPNSRIRGCLFHYGQAIWRKTQSLGLAARYKEDPAFNRFVRRALGLPFLPPHLIDDVWLEALNEVDDDEAEQLKNYITLNWVDNLTARFPNEVWSHHDNIGHHLQRTNNCLERWHRTINSTLTAAHPNVYKLIHILQKQQQEGEQNLRLLNAGHALPPPAGY